MAHYALINESNIVQNVIPGHDEDDLPEGIESWETYYGQVAGMLCVRTSYNTRGGVHYTQELDENENPIPSEDQSKALRYNYAQINGTYDPEADAFIPNKPNTDIDVQLEIDTNTYTWVVVTPS
jgi:hypothetical protein